MTGSRRARRADQSAENGIVAYAGAGFGSFATFF